MNVTGMGQYSRETSSIRQPGGNAGSKSIKIDVQQKLIFIYPILMADKIKVPNVQAFDNLIRDFISITFLSDMFIQNLFSVIGTANQIRPLWDEKNNSVDPTAGLLRMAAMQQGAQYGGVNSMPHYPVGSEHSGILQQKIQQKTAIIQRLLKTDPKMSKLRPYVEIITMGNMIDVPVIVGTASYPVDTLTLMYVLLAAIGLNKKLNNTQDLESIFKELESMDKEKYWRLLTKLIRTPEEHNTLMGIAQSGTFKVLHKVSGWNKYLPNSITDAAGNQAIKIQNRMKITPEMDQQRQIFAPLYLKQHDLDKTKMYFKFVLDPHFATHRFGINVGDEKSHVNDLFDRKLTGNFEAIHQITVGNFAEIIGSMGSSILRSVVNLVSVASSSVNYDEEKSVNINEDMFEKIDSPLKMIITAIEQGIRGSTVQESKNKIDIMNSLCDIDTDGYLKIFIRKTVDSSIMANDFTENGYRSFLQFFDAFVEQSESTSSSLEREIKYLAPDTERNELNLAFNNLRSVINVSVKNFLDPFLNELSASGIASPLASLSGANNQQIVNTTIPKFTTGLTHIFYFTLLSKLQVALCKSMTSMDVDLEMSRSEVTSWPNYTLVLPVEIVLALHAALMGMSWDHLLRGGEVGKNLKTKSTTIYDSGGSPTFKEKNKPLDREHANSLKDINDSYIKPAIKYIAERLDVPNLIVVDAKKGDMYYKLMNQTDVNKTKLTTIGTFIDSKINHQMTQQY